MNSSISSLGRAGWMSGKYGIMVHWTFAEPGNADAAVTAFDLDRFLADFDRTGASWLIFTVMHATGTSASPSKTLSAVQPPADFPRRDLVGEIAAALHARGRRFLAYLPTEAMGTSKENIAKVGWGEDVPTRPRFQKIWTDAIGEWSARWGANCDGWWFDGYYDRPEVWPDGALDARLWFDAARRGNPDAALAFNPGIIEVWFEPTRHVRHNTPRVFAKEGLVPDYLAGELNFFTDGRADIHPWSRPSLTWFPEGALVPGTRCLYHMLTPIDGMWGAYWPWPTYYPDHMFARAPVLKDAAALAALEARGEFPPPRVTREELWNYLRNVARVGAAATINVGIDKRGRLNPHTLALF